MFPSECNYPIAELELLAVVCDFKFWVHYLLGVRFKLFTDNKVLSHLRSLIKPSPRQLRWISLIEEFDFECGLIKGVDNNAADALSRINTLTGIAAEIAWENAYKNCKVCYDALLKIADGSYK